VKRVSRLQAMGQMNPSKGDRLGIPALIEWSARDINEYLKHLWVMVYIIQVTVIGCRASPNSVCLVVVCGGEEVMVNELRT
jgi:hypothetical protein